MAGDIVSAGDGGSPKRQFVRPAQQSEDGVHTLTGAFLTWIAAVRLCVVLGLANDTLSTFAAILFGEQVTRSMDRQFWF